MDHSTAVRIAQGGEGAIVSELLRLSDEIEKRDERIADLEAENQRLQNVIRLARISLGVDGTVEEFDAFEKALEEMK